MAAKKKKTTAAITVNRVGEFREAKLLFEFAYVEAVLTEVGGNMTRGAELAGKERKDFYQLVERAGVDPEEFRA